MEGTEITERKSHQFRKLSISKVPKFVTEQLSCKHGSLSYMIAQATIVASTQQEKGNLAGL